MSTRIPFAVVLTAAATLSSVSAQDMIGVTYTGEILAIESQTGGETVLAAGAFGLNCLARDDAGTLWSVSRATLGTPTYMLTSIDPATLQVQAWRPTGDIRALADAGNGELYAAFFSTGDYMLARIGTTSASYAAIGPTTTRLQAMTMHDGSLYGYSLDEGLGTIDTTDGAFTPLSGPQGFNVQWLASTPDGELIGGGLEYVRFDASNGAAHFYASGSNYVRGADASGMAFPYGDSCGGITLRCNGTLRPGSVLTTVSTGYPSTGALVGIGGAIVVGASRTSFQGVPLPLDLDPFLGTRGCSLHASVDASELSFTTGGAAPSLYRPILVPPALANYTVFVQHAGFDFNDRFFWSNGVQVHIGL